MADRIAEKAAHFRGWLFLFVGGVKRSAGYARRVPTPVRLSLTYKKNLKTLLFAKRVTFNNPFKRKWLKRFFRALPK